MIRKPLISVICPCFNEDAGIAAFFEKIADQLNNCRKFDFQLVFVDDGSTDRTAEILSTLARQDDRIQLLRLSRNFGHQVAVTAGLDASVGDAVIVMDADLQHPPALLPEMIRLWHVEGFDVVWAIREYGEKTSLLKRLTSRVFYCLINRVSDTRILPNAADFYLLSRQARNALCSMPGTHRFLRGMVSWIGYARTTVTFQAPERFAGRSKYTLRKMMRLALDAAFSFSTVPIRVAVRSGLAVAAAGFAYLAYILTLYFSGAELEVGWGSIISTLLILGGAQLTFTGLIGEYVARVFEQSKQRPLYFLRDDLRDVPDESGQNNSTTLAIRPRPSLSTTSEATYEHR